MRPPCSPTPKTAMLLKVQGFMVLGFGTQRIKGLRNQGWSGMASCLLLRGTGLWYTTRCHFFPENCVLLFSLFPKTSVRTAGILHEFLMSLISPLLAAGLIAFVFACSSWFASARRAVAW